MDCMMYNRNNTEGRSPLLRDLQRRPVHERLGISTPFQKSSPVSRIVCNRKRTQCMRKFRGAQNIANRIQQNITKLSSSSFTPNPISSLKIQVVNPEADILQRFQLRLNPVIQMEIKKIQNASPRQIFHGVHPIMAVATHISLNQRFSNLF